MAHKAEQSDCKRLRRNVSTLSEVRRRLNKILAKSEDFRVNVLGLSNSDLTSWSDEDVLSNARMFEFQFRMNLMSFLVVLISGFGSVYRNYRIAIERTLNSFTFFSKSPGADGIHPILL